MSGTCIFCLKPFEQTRGQSKEHILRKANLEALGHLKSPLGIQFFNADGSERIIHPVGNTFVASGVCKNCNDEWINDIDAQAETPLLALARGEVHPRELSEGDAKALSLWVTKSAYAAASMELGTFNPVPAKHISDFFLTREIPLRSVVLASVEPAEEELAPNKRIAYAASGFWKVTVPKFIKPPSKPIGYKIGFQLDRLLICLVHLFAVGYLLRKPGDVYQTLHGNSETIRVGEMLIPMGKILPLTPLNIFLANAGLIHKCLIPNGGEYWDGKETRTSYIWAR